MASKTIQLQGAEQCIRREAIAGGAITPGMIVELTNAASDTVVVHNSAGENVVPIAVAVEDDLQGNGITTAYASASMVQYNIQAPGSVFYGLVNDGENITKGAILESAGNGKVQAHAASSAGALEYPRAIVGVALDAVDMSDSSGADPNGRIRILVG